MLLLVIIARYRMANTLITAIMHILGVTYFVTIVVVMHESADVSLVMSKMIWCMVGIVRGKVVPIIWGTPRAIAMCVYITEQWRCLHKHGLHDISRTIDVRLANNLAVRSGITHLKCQGSYILEYVWCQDSLNYENMIITIDNLHDTQVVDITVAIKVEVGNHVFVRVKQHLKFLYSGRLCKSSGNSL